MILDTLKNLISGLGTSKDKSAQSGYAITVLSDTQLNAMHRSDWIAGKIVDIIPNDMTREWRNWQADAKAITAIEKVEQAQLISLPKKLNDVLRKARLFGGAVIYMGIKGADPTEPLDIDAIGVGDLEYLHVMLRTEVTVGEIIKDVTNPLVGEPEFYTVAGGEGGSINVHPSRMVPFKGREILDTQTQTDNGWGDSVLMAAYDAIHNASSVQQHIAAMVPEAKTDVIYIPNLSTYLESASTTQKLTDRFTYANTLKSMFNTLLLEGNGKEDGEKWEQKQINFAQLPELAQIFLQLVSGAADIPVTRLLGQSPAGMSSTGESDLRNYYDNVSARQRTELSPSLYRLDEVIIRSALGSRDEAIHYEWAPLWSLSEKERAEIFKTKADGARAIIGNGTSPALMPAEVLSESLANAFIEDGSLPGLELAIKAYGGLGEQDANEDDKLAAATPQGKQEANDATPRTLYVSRAVLNADEIIEWAKGQGFGTTLPTDDMHVTVMFSRAPVDWMEIGENWSSGKDGKLEIAPGGARMLEEFGGGAIVLMFASSELSYRHETMKQAGAEWSHPEYQPHITISYKGSSKALRDIEPYQGRIVLGPEIFAEVNEDWQSGVSEE